MLDRELVEAVKLAREAGAILLDVYGSDFSVRYKGEQDPVTEADTRVNSFLVGRIRESFPSDSIIAEETASSNSRATSNRCWYIDPLDGTKEFIAKNGEFSVMIGLAVDGEARLGVVYQPTEGKLYRGVVGDGAFLEHGDKTWVLKVSDTEDPKDMRLVVSRSHRSEATGKLVEKLGISKEFPSGSVGLKVGLLAERKADLYVHLSDKTSAWDACAPDAILRASGGIFVDLAGRSLEYSGSELKNKRGILACNRKGFDAVAPAVLEIAKGTGLVAD
ncbi:MAG: 3'(2'),5'-bisphosphate nucleotidase CysQ [Deltaproteobacteria bacterium]|jgi:3'(2'), 5'-bisphosphate nucleotidase